MDIHVAAREPDAVMDKLKCYKAASHAAGILNTAQLIPQTLNP